LYGGMASTERGMWSGNRGATLTAAGSEMLASLRSKGGFAGFIFSIIIYVVLVFKHWAHDSNRLPEL
jgi:hypothetical protein